MVKLDEYARIRPAHRIDKLSIRQLVLYVDFPDGRRLVSVLLATWAYSNCPFAIALPTERTEAISHGLVEAFALRLRAAGAMVGQSQGRGQGLGERSCLRGCRPQTLSG